MAISDSYMVRHLAAETVLERDPLVWSEPESGGYLADRNGVRIHVIVSQSRTGSRIWVTFSRNVCKAHIAEPLNTGILRPKYADAEQSELAMALRELVEAIGAQIAARERLAREAAGEIRESVFRQVLFGAKEAEGGEALVGWGMKKKL